MLLCLAMYLPSDEQLSILNESHTEYNVEVSVSAERDRNGKHVIGDQDYNMVALHREDKSCLYQKVYGTDLVSLSWKNDSSSLASLAVFSTSESSGHHG